MSDLYGETMSLKEAQDRAEALLPTLEGPDQQAVDKYREVAKLAVEMRLAQRRYYADQTRENLIQAKELERRFDRLVQE